MNRSLVLMMLIAMLLPLSCSRQKQERVVARVNGDELTLSEFRYRLSSLPPQMQVFYAYEEGHREFLDNLVEQKLLYQEAKRQRLDRDPVIRSRIDNYVEQTRVTIERNIEKLRERLDDLESTVEENLLAKEMLDRAGPTEVEVSEEEIEEYYKEMGARALKGNPDAEVPDLGLIRREIRAQLVKKKFVEGLKEDAELEVLYERLGPDMR